MIKAGTIALWTVVLVLAFALPTNAESDIASVFTYQAQLTENGVLANGVFDMQFRLWDAPMAGNQVGVGVFAPGVQVVDGRLTETLDFGPDVFTGASRYLEVSIFGAAGPITLGPRQMITPAPEAHYAASASEAIGSFRISPNTRAPTLYFGAGMDTYIAAELSDVTGLVLAHPDGARVYNSLSDPPAATLRFGHTDETYIECRGAGKLEGLLLHDPFGIRLVDHQDSEPRLYFGETNDTFIGHSVDPAKCSIWADPAGFTLEGGFVGLGLTGADYRLMLPNSNSPSGQAIANAWMTYSSKRWKENVRTIDDALDIIGSLRGVRYNWKADHGGGADIGFVAEEVGAVLPELVTWEDDGRWARSLDTDGIVAITVEGIRAQQSQLHRLRDANTMLVDRIDSLEAENQRLRERLDRLEAIVDSIVSAEVDR